MRVCIERSFTQISEKVNYMQATVRWLDAVSFQTESGTGHSVQTDGPESAGGQNHGPRPMELLLMGMGACASYDVVSMLRKGRQDVTDCVASLDAERADAVPAVFTKIKVKFTVTGRELKESQVKRAVSLSAEKYCSASIMLAAAGVEIQHSYEVLETSG